jgi:curved DNA-binding protein CbpA
VAGREVVSVHEDWYSVLEVAPHARPQVIEAAFGALRELAVRDESDAAPRTLVQLNRAHAVLCNPLRRAAYDQERDR